VKEALGEERPRQAAAKLTERLESSIRGLMGEQH
jgi:hypothetical protein